jgi:hypothetical protein
MERQVDQLSFELLVSEFQMNVRSCIVSDSRHLLMITRPYNYVMFVHSAIQFKKALHVIRSTYCISTYSAMICRNEVRLAYIQIKIDTLFTVCGVYFRYNEFAQNRSSETSAPVNISTFVSIRYLYISFFP